MCKHLWPASLAALVLIGQAVAQDEPSSLARVYTLKVKSGHGQMSKNVASRNGGCLA